MPSKLKKAIGAVKDQTSISLAKVASSNSSSNIDIAVLKATTHDNVPIHDRYIHEILHLVSSDKSHASACARALGKRIGRTRNWIVALKSLMLVLRIFQDGDPYFPREVLHAMKRGARILNLSTFRDDSNSSSPWDFTAFIRTFALYLDERLDCFLTGKLQRRVVYQGTFHQRKTRHVNDLVREMKPAVLLDKISNWQRLLDRAVATRPTGAARTNRLVQICLYAVVQETFDLYKDISDGLALLLDSFFHLQYNSCVNAFQATVKATKQFEELSSFYDLCKSIGVGRTSEYPSVQKISQELIETLQEFLKDKSSFPSTGKSTNWPPQPQRQNLLSPPPVAVEESNSQCTSLEDLISATELTTGANPVISIDLEDYSMTYEFENPTQKDDAFSVNDDAISTQSLPVTSSMVDLLSFDGWSEFEQVNEKCVDDHKDIQDQPMEESTTGWELVLAETTNSSISTQSMHNSLSIDSLYEQCTVPLAPDQYYNPFLQDITELTDVASTHNTAPETTDVAANFSAVDDGFLWGASFEATPTFCAQDPSTTSSVNCGFQIENDPFAPYPNGSINQQDLLNEQQLWLQQQNKIIAKHMG